MRDNVNVHTVNNALRSSLAHPPWGTTPALSTAPQSHSCWTAPPLRTLHTFPSSPRMHKPYGDLPIGERRDPQGRVRDTQS